MAGGILGAGAKLVGGLASASASKKAASAQQEAAALARKDLEPWREAGQLGLTSVTGALGLTKNADGQTWGEEFDLQAHQLMGQEQLQSNVNPYSVENLSEGFEASPGYEYQLDQGQRAIEGSAAARGGMLSGNNLLDATRHSQGIAAQDYWNFVDHQFQGKTTDANMRQTQYQNLWGLSEAGRLAAAQSGQFALAGASQAGQYTAQAGQALGQGISQAGSSLAGDAGFLQGSRGGNNGLSSGLSATGSTGGFNFGGGFDFGGGSAGIFDVGSAF